MATKITSTVGNVAADLAEAGLPPSRPVELVVLDEEDEAKLARLRKSIAAAETTEEVDGDQAFAEIRASFADHHTTSS